MPRRECDPYLLVRNKGAVVVALVRRQHGRLALDVLDDPAPPRSRAYESLIPNVPTDRTINFGHRHGPHCEVTTLLIFCKGRPIAPVDVDLQLLLLGALLADGLVELDDAVLHLGHGHAALDQRAQPAPLPATRRRRQRTRGLHHGQQRH